MADHALNYVRCPYCDGNLADLNHPCDDEARDRAAKEAVESMMSALNTPPEKATKDQLRRKLIECEAALEFTGQLLDRWRAWARGQYGPNVEDLAEGFIASIEEGDGRG